MTFLAVERAVLERLLPGLDATLASTGLESLEAPDGDGIEMFRRSGGPALVVPQDLRGLGASALDAVRVQRAIGARSPSVAVASTMHHFSVATLISMMESGLESILVEAIASERLIVASGFAEGTGEGILAPSMIAIDKGSVLTLSGSKKPCSLVRSMDLLTASVMREGRLSVVLVPVGLPGVELAPFWSNAALAGTQTGEVRLNEVEIPHKLCTYAGDAGELDRIQISGFLWFELLIAASYVGAACALVERALAAEHHSYFADAADALSAVETASAAIDFVASRVDEGASDHRELSRMLGVRYGVERLVRLAADAACDVLGGRGFAASNDVTLLLASARALAYHPPRRAAMSTRLVNAANGHPLRMS